MVCITQPYKGSVDQISERQEDMISVLEGMTTWWMGLGIWNGSRYNSQKENGGGITTGLGHHVDIR